MSRPSFDSGQTRRKAKVVLVTDSLFIPPSVTYNPFRHQKNLSPERVDHVKQALSLDKKKPASATQSAVVNTRSAQKPHKPVIRSVRPPSSDSSLSDWTDCDEEEFDNLGVRTRLMLQQTAWNLPMVGRCPFNIMCCRSGRLQLTRLMMNRS